MLEYHQNLNIELTDYIVQPSSFWTRKVWQQIGELDKYYVICPTNVIFWKKEELAKAFNGKPVSTGFSYNSGENTEWLTVEDLRRQIVEHVDSRFKI